MSMEPEPVEMLRSTGDGTLSVRSNRPSTCSAASGPAHAIAASPRNPVVAAAAIVICRLVNMCPPTSALDGVRPQTVHPRAAIGSPARDAIGSTEEGDPHGARLG